MADLGVRLQLLVGPTVPGPAPYELVDALDAIEVTNRDRERDGFQLSFSVGKDSLVDYGPLRQRMLEPPARVTVLVVFGGGPEVLINGMVTDHQLVPSNRPGESTLHVTGEDLGLQLDLDPRSAVFRNQSDSEIVSSIVSSYGLRPQVQDTSDRPSDQQRVTSQQGSDLAFVRYLAWRNGFVFFVEPTGTPGVSAAYWGPERRTGRPQPALSVSTGPLATVDDPITFQLNALGPATPRVTMLDVDTGRQVEVPLPSEVLAALSRSPSPALRKVVARDAAKLDPVQAALRAFATSSEATDAVTGRGELDAVRYGRVLRSRRTVDVQGAGSSHDGTYYVREVTHRLRRGSYRQSFVLSRDGRGATNEKVVVS